nr:immunoglobulin heavy chain junction region [Mus musculus]MBK4197288.1 immunoglobulin heavy chain junction region [Mus musculus]
CARDFYGSNFDYW